MTTLANPAGAFGETASWDDATVQYFKASGAITANHAVSMVAGADFHLVELLDVSDNLPRLFRGIALAAAADGEQVPVVTHGPVIAKFKGTPSNAPGVGTTIAIIGDVDGEVDSITPAETHVIGVGLGTFLTAEIGTTDTAWLFVERT